MPEPIYLNFISLFGLFGFCAIAYLFSEDRRVSLIPWSLIIWGIVGLSGKALLAGTLATLMVACLAGLY